MQQATHAIQLLHGRFVKGLCTDQGLVSNYARVRALDRRAVFRTAVLGTCFEEQTHLEKPSLPKPSLEISMPPSRLYQSRL